MTTVAARRVLASAAAAVLMCLLSSLHAVNGLARHDASLFHGTALVVSRTTALPQAASTACRSFSTSITMRKQKASDRRTRKRQRGEIGEDEMSSASAAAVASATTLTTSPMSAAGPWRHKTTATLVPAMQRSTVAVRTKKTLGRGRSRKRSTLYNSLSFYHDKFLHLLTAEYQAEEDEVLGRIKASADDPLGLEMAGYALYDLYPERRGNIFSDEVYRLGKARDATTVYPCSLLDDSDDDEVSNPTARYLPPNHKFSRNDVIMLTLQPNGSGDFFDPVTTLPVSDKAITAEARVLNTGPTYVDIAVPQGMFEATFGPAPNDMGGAGDKSMRVRADRFFSNVPYQRMVAALAQISSIPDRSNGKKNTMSDKGKDDDNGKGKNPHDNIVMDEVLRDVILATHAFTDPNSPHMHDPDVCDTEELANKIAKPPMASSHKLATQAVKYMKSNPHGIFNKFNAPQLASIEAALTRRLTLIQGPPGSGKTTVASAIGFGMVHQTRTISSNAKVLACAFSNVGADNLAEALVRLGLKIVRVGKASAVSEVLWDSTLDAAIDRDPAAQKAIRHAARATMQLAKSTKSKGRGGVGTSLSERTLREAATSAVKASIQACNVAATKALREADVVVSTSTGAADPRLLAACGVVTGDETEKDSRQGDKPQAASKPWANAAQPRVDAPDGLAPLSLPFVIVDEACQSVEPATLIPLTASNSCRSLVLLGDPCQLPPTVRSGDATPLSVSLMERLAATLPAPSVNSPVDNTLKDTSFLDTRPIKQSMSLLRSRERGERQHSSYRNRFAGSLLLSIQYRMHPSIAAFPSAIFYDGLLSTPSFMSEQRSFPRALNAMMPCGDPSICVRMVDVGGRGNERRGMPSGFTRTVFGTATTNALEEQTSYWNEPEAQRVLSLIKDVLLTEGSPDVSTIGVVTPYNAQVQLIKGMLASDPDLQEMLGRLPATIEVKSVDGYQGRERDLIIFSTVRSNRQGRIGFLHDWRRMNVALTRAKSGLVIVGDLTTLAEADKYWDALRKWGEGVRCIVDDWDSPEDEPSI